MDRTLMLLTLLLVPISGCLDGSPGNDLRPTESAHAGDVTMDPRTDAPEPVYIDETHDLSRQSVDRDWDFRIHPGATAATIRFAFEGFAGTPLAKQGASMCFEIRGPHIANEICRTANANIQVSVVGSGNTLFESETYYESADAAPGAYHVHFDSLPTAGTFAAHVNVQYD